MQHEHMEPKRLAPQQSAHLIGADVIRIIACLFVVSIHFLLNIGFYNAPIEGTNMHIMLVMRMLFSICVPLFLILTGYLMVNRKLSASHYGKGMKVVWIYLLASLACIIFKLYLQTPHVEDPKAWENSIKDILVYRAAPYSWYIEMYFGLYLLIPFFGILYRGLPSRKWKIVLIISLMALNTLPKFINSFNFETPGWWSDPTLSDQFQKLVPRWWYYNTYPVTYFFIGAYLREYGLRLNGILHRVLIVVTLGLSTLFELWRSGKGKFNWGLGSEWDFLLTMILSTLIFALLVQKPYRHIPNALAKVLHYISGLTLSMFLVSYIFDTLFYKILNEKVKAMPDRLVWYFVIVPAVFLASMALSAVIDMIYRLVALLCGDIRNSLRPKRRKRAQDAPHETPQETPQDAPMDTPQDASQDVPQETQPDAPMDTPLDVPLETLLNEPADEG